MGSRCHYPFWDKGSVCAHLLSAHRCRTAQDISYVFGSHGWFSSNRSFLSAGGVPCTEYETATRHRRYNHNPRLIQGANQPWLGTSVNDTTRRRLRGLSK